ncbi:YoaK family protein [Streptococcus suis]
MREYRVYEGLRVATCLTFVSGYLNAFSYLTQGGRFAGVQSGNVVLLASHLAQGSIKSTIHFLVPIVFFTLGQFFTYLAKKYFLKHRYPWHFGSSLIILCLIVLTIVLTPFVNSFFTMGLLAFTASIQVETFRSLKGVHYANVMMTGNVKNAAYIWFKGLMEKNAHLQETGRNIYIIILGFMLGVCLSTLFSQSFGEYALLGVLPFVLYINWELWKEKRPARAGRR